MNDDTSRVLLHYAHDLSNPLTAARVLIDLLRDDAPAGMRADLDDLAEAVDLCGVMADGLSDFARVAADAEPTYDASPVRLEAVVEQAVERAAPGLAWPTTDAMVSVDRNGAARALAGILVNGARMAEPGALELVIESTSVGLIHHGVHLEAADVAALTRLDGVNALRARRIRCGAFGLATVARTAEWLGARLDIRQAPDGLSVWLHLPAA